MLQTEEKAKGKEGITLVDQRDTAFPADFDRLSLAHFPHICGVLPLNRSTIRGQRASNVRKMLYAITYQNQRETLYLALRIINYSLGARNLI